jgi:hypothetical protein
VHVGNVEGYLASVVKFCFADGIAAQIAGFREGLSEVGLSLFRVSLDWLHGPSILAIINWCFDCKSCSLPGVRLITWTILASSMSIEHEPCFDDCKNNAVKSANPTPRCCRSPR